MSHIKFGIIGGSGKMATALTYELQNKVVVIFSRKTIGNIYTNDLDNFLIRCDVVIDFSRPDFSLQLMEKCFEHKKPPIVCGTTGFLDNEMKVIKQYATEFPIFYSSNMSIGIAILSTVVENAVKMLNENQLEYDLSILERHHKNKADKPSGTAKMLAKKINCEDKNITAMRYGNVFGEHEVIMSTESEIITLSHVALNRSIFAKGAIIAAKYLLKQRPGRLYNMDDIVKF